MRLFYALIVAGLVAAGSVAAEAPATQIDPRKVAWVDRVNALLSRMQTDALALKEAAESGDSARVCSALRPMVGHQKSMRDLQVEYAQIDPESAKARGFADKQAQMDAQIVEMDAQLKAKCG